MITAKESHVAAKQELLFVYVEMCLASSQFLLAFCWYEIKIQCGLLLAVACTANLLEVKCPRRGTVVAGGNFKTTLKVHQHAKEVLWAYNMQTGFPE